jgi:hypothetical protein
MKQRGNLASVELMSRRIHKWLKCRILFFCHLGLFISVLCLSACSSPTQKIDASAIEYGMQHRVIKGDGFNHIAYLRIKQPHSRRIHIYIEGDGRPWLDGREVSADPTTKQPLALSLANLDSENILYLGRPCYMGLFQDGDCKDIYWTSARYSPVVVQSMVAAVNDIAAEFDIDQSTLIGYSGGGSLAMLMASDLFFQQIPSLVSVVTIAGNLDVASWTAHHGYLPLSDSLDPAKLNYPGTLKFLHFGGAEDKNVSSSHLLNFVSLHGGQYKILADIDHSCCWLQRWPELLQKDVNPIGRVAE